MAYAVWHGVITDLEGNVVPGAQVEVRSELTGALIRLYEDRNGSSFKTNPFQADEQGQASFFATGGAYRITARSGTFERVWRYVGIGTAQEADVEALGMYLQAGLITVQTKAALTAIVPDSFPMGGVVLADPVGANNGYYTNQGSGWVFARPLPDTFARLYVTGGTANAVQATLDAGVNPSAPSVFFIDVETPNTGPVTITINGANIGPVLNAAGNPLAAGEWQGRILFTRESNGDYKIVLNDPASALSAALSATQAGNARDASVAAQGAAEDARDDAEAAASAASTSASNAATSASNAATSESNAAASETAAAGSASTASGAATTATTQAGNAASSASDAATSEANAAASEAAAGLHADRSENEADRSEAEANRAEAAASSISNPVSYNAQSPSSAEQAQARANLGITDDANFLQEQDSRTAAQGQSFKPDVNWVRTAGFAAPGDGGGALYKRVSSEPSHAGKFQSADGAWWEVADIDLNVKMFGAIGDGSTSDQTAIASAVSLAASLGVDLYWPKGQYFTTANIPNLHTVRHRGPGAIKRGSSLFYVEPGKANSNTLYAATSGSSGNDGLSASQPINTIQGGLTAMENYGPVLNGSWTLQVAAGTYAEAVTTGLRSTNAVTIKGPDVSGGVPTVILDGGSGARSFGIYAGPYINFNVFDIKAQNYSAYSFVAHNASMMNLYNCHSSGSTEAQANAEDRSRLYILGGIYNGGKYGVRIYSQSTGSIRKDTRYNTAAQFNNATAAGIYIRENSNARADDFTSNGCNIAANAANSRLHVVNASITNATVGCQADRGGEVYDDNVTYGLDVVTRRKRLSGGRFLAQSNGPSQNAHAVNTAIVHTGTTTLTTLWTGPVIEAFELDTPDKSIEVEIRGKWGSGTTATTIYVALEGATGNLAQVNSPLNSPNVFVIRAVIVPRGVNSQLVHTELLTHAAASLTATSVTRTADVSTDRAIQVRAALGANENTLTIDRIKVTRLG